MLSTVSPQPAREPLQGKRLLNALRKRGIEATDVTRNRKTGVYVVRFTDPNKANFYSRGTYPARVWAERILECFDDVEVIDTHDSVAEWRPTQPVLWATVFLRVIPAGTKSAQAEAQAR